MGCGSSRTGVVHVPPQHVTTTTHYSGAATVTQQIPPQHGYPQQGGYPVQRPYPQQRVVAGGNTTYVQQPGTVVVQDRGSSAGDFMVGMAAGAMISNAMHGPHYYHGYHGGYHGGYHDYNVTEVHHHEHFHEGEGDFSHDVDYGENMGGGFDGGGDFDCGGCD